MKPLALVFCIWSLPAHAAQAPARSPHFLPPVPEKPGPESLLPPKSLAAPESVPAPRARLKSDVAFEDYFNAEAEFLACDERYEEAPEGSAQRQAAARDRALAFEIALRLFVEIVRHEDIRSERWESFALASEGMRREAAPGSVASVFFEQVEIRAWPAFRASAERELRGFEIESAAVEAAEHFQRQFSAAPADSPRRALYGELKAQAWDRAYALLDQLIERLLPIDWPALEIVVYHRITPGMNAESNSPRTRDFYRRARAEIWSAIEPAILNGLLSDYTNEKGWWRALYTAYARSVRPDSDEWTHYQRMLVYIRAASSDGRQRPHGIQQLEGRLRRARGRGIEHFHSRHEDIESRERPS